EPEWVGDRVRRRGLVPPRPGGVALDHDALPVRPDRIDLAGRVDDGHGEELVVPGAERPVPDLIVVPDHHRRPGEGDVGDGADSLVDAVEVGGPVCTLVHVVLGAVRSLEDRVQLQNAGGRIAARDDVPQLVVGQVTRPLPDRDVGDHGAALHVRLAAVQRDADLDLPGAGDVVVGHVHRVEATAVQLRIGYLPHPVIPEDL